MTNYTFQSLFDFTRTTSGTFVGSNGLIQTTPASVNLLLQTQAFDSAGWTKFNSTINANVTSAPDGTSTADALVENTTSGNHIVQQFVSYTSGASYTFSFYVKAGTRAWTRITMPSAAFGTEVSSFYNLSGAGSLGTASGPVTARTITAVGNGWYRITLTGVATATAGGNTIVFSASADNTSFYTGVTGAEAIFIWGAQVEAAATATDYTRNNGGLFPPRFDYDPATLAPKGILIEEQRTNLSVYSQTPSDASWSATSCTKTSTNNPDPFGTTTALLLTADGISTTHFLIASGAGTISYTSGTSYTISCFLKAGTTSRAQITFPSAAFGAGQYANYLLTGSGSVTASTGGTATITQFPNGYYRITWTAAATVTSVGSAGVMVFITSGTDARLPTNTSADNIYIIGWQTEAGAFATSYIPTVASQVTRTADTCSIVAPLFAPWYNQSEGTFVASADTASFLDLRRNIQVDDGTNAERIYLGTNTAANPLTVVSDGGAIQANLPAASTTLTVNTPYKIAMTYKINDFAVVGNGGTVAVDSLGTLPTVLQLRLGANENTVYLNGHIRSIRYYPVRLADFQLQALTA
jgi:hypothetical protein